MEVEELVQLNHLLAKLKETEIEVVSVNSQGRLLIPHRLRQQLGITGDRSFVALEVDKEKATLTVVPLNEKIATTERKLIQAPPI